EVAVKKFRDTTNVSSDLLNEVNFNLKMNNENGGIETIRIYGVTRDPQNGEYAIVIQFKNGGNLRKMIKEHYSNLTWETILEILRRISEGLNSVHESKYYHKDLHSGNILNKILFDNTVGESVISDFDLDFNEFKSIEDELIEVNGEFKSIEDELIEVNGEFNDDESIEISESESESIEISEDESIELNENKSSKLSEDRKLQIKKAFSREREDKWKARLAELATNPIPLKDSQNLLTSKRLDYSQSLSLKLSVEDWK
ncbi:20116_t:CDS:2, partial [Rhizophagus irregularis]